MAHTAKGKAQGDALLAHLNAQASIVALGLVGGARWTQGARQEPAYPTDPRGDCPSLELRMRTEEVSPGNTYGRSHAGATFTLWYKRRQTPGQDHQQLLVQDVEAIINVLLGRWRPAGMVAVAGQSFYGVYPKDPPIVHDELRHEFDDPALRVSVAEIPLVAQSDAIG